MAQTSYDPRRRGDSFDSVADLYDRYRPTYPPEVVAALAEMAALEAGCRVLEIAPGAGQLSGSLAELGAELTAVELGPRLAAKARARLSGFPLAAVEVSSFESWPLPEEPFDVVVCATAFHWLDPELRFSKTARALRPGGSLAIVHAHHVDGGTHGFVRASQELYVRFGLSDDPFFEPPSRDDVPPIFPELEERPEFTSVERRRFDVESAFSAESYVGLLSTDSLVLGLDEAERRGFLDGIGALIDSSFDGAITKRYVYEVAVARRVIRPDGA